MKIEELQRICDAATPGPWGWCYDGSSDWSVGPKDDPQGRQIANCWRSRAAGNPDAEFIAAFNPAVVAKLLVVAKAADRCSQCESEEVYDAIWELGSALKALVTS